uniref:Uncharacterized protein n=1 Tax=Siphoviridae sp. cteDy1 TaxID=2825587 RepID=A0A8S5V4A1_9CAUD|nr:MAG TPA: hypothetical protein [Siphoviridae sp. cteDy1]DAQ66576.1 MAG TPA: hypothetical protein [Caudoviricetes sp.]
MEFDHNKQEKRHSATTHPERLGTGDSRSRLE